MVTTNDLGQPVGDAVPPLSLSAPSRTPLHGRYCRVVPLDPFAHGQALHAAFAAAADDGDWTYLPYGPFASRADFNNWLSSVSGHDDPMFFTIIDEATGLAVGLASYLRINPSAASIEVGHIHLSRSLQRTPAATEAMHLLMQRAFDAGYRRYEWKCDDLNAPSRAAAERLGFVYEGTFRKATHYKGRSRDTAWFAIIEDAWPLLNAEFNRWLHPNNFADDGTQLSPLANRPLADG